MRRLQIRCVSLLLGLMLSYLQLSGNKHNADKLARILKRMKTVHGPLWYLGTKQEKPLLIADSWLSGEVYIFVDFLGHPSTMALSSEISMF